MALSTAATLLALASCSHYSEFDAREDDCLRDGYTTGVDFSFKVKRGFSSLDSLELAERGFTRADMANLRYRYQMYVIPEGDSVPVEYYSGVDDRCALKLPVGHYRAVSWADIVPADSVADWHYLTNEPREMMLRYKAQYTGGDGNKLCWSSVTPFTVSYRTPAVSLPMTPHMGSFEIRATDKPDFKVGRIRVSYPAGVPAAVDVFRQKVSYVWGGVEFLSSSVSPVVASDYVLAEDELTTLPVKITVYDEYGTIRARRWPVNIALQRGRHDVVSTHVFDVIDPDGSEYSDAPGIGIDDQFDETIDIVL